MSLNKPIISFLLSGMLLMFAYPADILAGEGQEGQPLKVFVFAGQSNMVGTHALVQKLPEEIRAGSDKVLVFKDGKWEKLVPGKYQKEGFGPEVSCARKLAESSGETVGVIKFGVGATDLARQWNPNHRKKSNLYYQLVDIVKAARASRKIEIVGMFWMQGERDSRKQSDAEAYAENFDRFISSARKDFESPEMFFVAGRVNPPAESYKARDAVRKAQQECKATGYAWVDCDGLSMFKDNLHFDADGQIKLGELFAAAMLKLKKGAGSGSDPEDKGDKVE